MDSWVSAFRFLRLHGEAPSTLPPFPSYILGQAQASCLNCCLRRRTFTSLIIKMSLSSGLQFNIFLFIYLFLRSNLYLTLPVHALFLNLNNSNFVFTLNILGACCLILCCVKESFLEGLLYYTPSSLWSI